MSSDPLPPDAPLGARIDAALDDRAQQGALRHAVEGVNRTRRRVMAGLPGRAGARARARAVKERAIAELPALLDRLEAEVVARGGVVHRAADGDEACRIITDIATSRQVGSAVKSKSMTSEEIHLNRALEAAGIHVRETDLGEYIVQLSGGRPSHIVAPIIHMTVDDVREAFRKGLALEKVPDAPPDLTQLARRELRREFLGADLGITGANFLLADTGTVVLVENEGNGRLSTQVPPVHVVLAGVDKVIPAASDLLPFLQLLPRSATGQLQTSYLSFISGPGWQASPLTGERRREMHLVLLDNGRTAMRDDPLLREALYCIRCGACMTVCPPYQVVGGHVYGGPTYHSGIGNAWEAGVRGLETAAAFNDLCTTCSRCQDVCPVQIDIPWMNAVLRDRIARSRRPRRRLLESVVFRPLLPDEDDRSVSLTARLLADPGRLYRWLRVGGGLARRLLASSGMRRLLAAATGLDARRPLPVPEGERLADGHRRRGGVVVVDAAGATALVEGGPGAGPGPGPAERHRWRHAEDAAQATVVLLADCHTEHLEPGVGRAAVDVLERLGYAVVVVADRCCGRAALSQGLVGTAEGQARRLQEILHPLVEAGHPVVGLEPSCLSAVVDDHADLLRDGSAHATSRGCRDLLEFLVTELARRREAGQPPAWARSEPLRVVLHGHCQQKTMGWLEPTVRLLEEMPGVEVAMTTAECCGMAGSFGYKRLFSGISVELGRRLAGEVDELLDGAGEGTEVLACGTSCRAQLADVAGRPSRHPVELLAERLV